MNKKQSQETETRGGCCLHRLVGPATDAALWLLKWPVLYDLQIVCIVNVLSLLYINLLPEDPLNLSPVKRYLLPLNAYALGTVLRQIVKYVARRKVGGDGQGDRHDDKHRDSSAPIGIELSADGTIHGDARRG